jgi:hypothetical protein
MSLLLLLQHSPGTGKQMPIMSKVTIVFAGSTSRNISKKKHTSAEGCSVSPLPFASMFSYNSYPKKLKSRKI